MLVSFENAPAKNRLRAHRHVEDALSKKIMHTDQFGPIWNVDASLTRPYDTHPVATMAKPIHVSTTDYLIIGLRGTEERDLKNQLLGALYLVGEVGIGAYVCYNGKQNYIGAGGVQNLLQPTKKTVLPKDWLIGNSIARLTEWADNLYTKFTTTHEASAPVDPAEHYGDKYHCV